MFTDTHIAVNADAFQSIGNFKALNKIHLLRLPSSLQSEFSNFIEKLLFIFPFSINNDLTQMNRNCTQIHFLTCFIPLLHLYFYTLYTLLFHQIELYKNGPSPVLPSSLNRDQRILFILGSYESLERLKGKTGENSIL